MALAVELRETRVCVDERRSSEHVLFHAGRGSLVSLTSSSLQEWDAATGAVMGEIPFEMLPLAAGSATGVAGAGSSHDKSRILDHWLPVGRNKVVGVYQSRCLVVWDLQDMVLHAVSEVDKVQKGIVAIAGSLCKDQWLFYASEGSHSIKVTNVDSKEVAKKISRKAANRNSQLSCLAYSTSRRVLACGCSDGALQLWSFSEENSSETKQEAAIASLLFGSQTTQSPVVQLTFGSSTNRSFLVVAYQNRTVEVWDLFANSSRPKDPQRIASIQIPHAQEFAKKNGELAFVFHPETAVLLIHWHSYTMGSSIAAWEFASKQGALSPWFNLALCSQRHRSETDDCVAAAVGWFQQAPIAYVSSHRRTLSVLSVDGISTGDESMLRPSLSTSFQLNLEQYRSYQEIPSALFAVTANPEANSSLSAAAHVLQQVSLLTGTAETVQDLPVWQNYQGKSLLPWQLLCDEKQSAICIKLKDSTKSRTSSEDSSFAYVMAEIKTNYAAGSQQRNENDDDGGGNTSSAVRVSCGSMMDALDVSFCQYRSEESKQRYPWLMLVLASTGKTISLQSRLDTLNTDRITLNREVLRVFSTPLMLSANSPHASMIGSRLLFLVHNATKDDVEMLQMSDDDLNVPSGRGSWSTNAHERVLDVVWNASTSGKATTQGSSMAPGELTLVAVWTTQRLVVLTANLVQVCALDLVHDLDEPRSALWMVHSLVFVTKSNQLRFIAPLKGAQQNSSRLLCSLAETNSDASTPSARHVQLLSVCGDRLAYAVTDAQSLETKVLLRPVSICEPLLTGFTTPNCHLRAILEREVLVFALSGGNDTLCPVTDRLLHLLYHDFGWRDSTLLLLNTLIRPPNTSNASTGSSSGATATGTSSSFGKTSHLSRSLLGSIFLHSHQWKDFLAVFLSTDPALEEYALAEDDGATATKLPSRTGRLAGRFRSFAHVLERLGQLDLALKCYDLAGDDLALLELGRKMGPLGDSILKTLQKDWKRINEPLSSIVEANVKSSDNNQTQLESAVWRRHDLFSLLCCDSLLQTERRSRLLSSVQPINAMKVNAAPCISHDKEEGPSVRAAVLAWKRLAPEDVKDVSGVSPTPHMASEDPKNPNYAVLASSGSCLGGSASKLGSSFDGEQGRDDNGGGAMDSSAQDESSATSSAAKQSIGPFLDEEDAVVAYWRFEEGNTADLSSSSSPDTSLECMDTSKRENNLQVVGFGSMMTLVKSGAPVDKGEDNRIQEEFALRFPCSSDAQDKQETEWGARCSIARGTTLDIAMICDEDPYRRKFTFEAWVRNFQLAEKLQQQQDQEDNGGGDADEWGSRSSTGSASMADPETRMLVSRTAASESNPVWAFSLVSGYLTLVYGGQSVKSDEAIANAAQWQHVAFSVDITSQSQATIKLFLQGRCVAVKNLPSLDANAITNSGDTSTLFLGRQLTDYELTEVRLWANARTSEQLSDMKENYLGIAEAKKRMKIAIHKRNCTCEKCQGRRTKAPVAKLTLSSPFPASPPTATVRDRRRPGAAAAAPATQ